MKNQMISDFNIEGLANSAPALEVLDIMLYILHCIVASSVGLLPHGRAGG